MRARDSIYRDAKKIRAEFLKGFIEGMQKHAES